jgi:Fe-Mn family superoxide dismutase
MHDSQLFNQEYYYRFFQKDQKVDVIIKSLIVTFRHQLTIMKRRKFINDVTKAGLFIGAVSSVENAFAANTEKMKYFIGFDQNPLPYDYAALEPAIDARTMEIHYTKHAAAYSTNLKDAAKAESVDPSTPVEKLLGNISKYSPKMRNNGGGHFNHELFWKT